MSAAVLPAVSPARSALRAPSPKTVTFVDDVSVAPHGSHALPKYYTSHTTTHHVRRKFATHKEWERYLNALLADLQNTVSPGSLGGGGSTPGYGSLNGPRHHYSNANKSVVDGSNSYTKTDSYEVRSSPYGKTQSPAGSRSPGGQPPHGGYGSGYVPSNLESSSSATSTLASKTSRGVDKRFNNNLSELDTLLQDLSSAEYSNITANGSSSLVADGGGGSSSGGRSPASCYGSRPSSVQGARPTVDSLLEELNAGEVIYAGPKKVTITVKETKTETGFPGETELLSQRVTTTAGRPPAAASTATRELDDLMATLSDFKVASGGSPQHHRQQHHQPAPAQYAYATKTTTASLLQAGPPPSHKHNLDSMLGNLQTEMSRQGVNTSQKGCCGACEKPIVGQVITALGKTWHPEHFTCAHCSQELGTRNFFEREGKPYCEPDYHNLFSPRCAYCNGPILDKCVTALEKTWHMEHFFCAQCGKQFGEEGFHEREGKPYCRDDYFDMFAPKCGGCNRSIMENYISALNTQWHPDCFVCRDCRQPFYGGSFFDHEGQPYCETHYHSKRGSLCAGCHKPITGRCITAMFRKFHPEHFVCAFCLKQLNKGTFKEQNDKPYCHGCFEKLFG